MRTSMAAVLALGLMAFAASAARADTYACVNKSSGTPKIQSCTVGTNAGCHKNESCIDLSSSSSGTPTNESWSSCTESLCIDAPPQGPLGLDGSGGWGWDSSANAPVTLLTVGQAATFTVTVLQPNPASTPGSITLTYSSQDFTLSDTSSRGATATTPAPFDRGGVKTFAYDGSFFGHNDQSDSFTFTPQNPTATALVAATINVGGQEASETFPVAIKK